MHITRHCLVTAEASHSSYDAAGVAVQSGMARMPDNPALMIMYASFLIEVRKDGQGARTQLQLAQKANPSLVDSLNIYMAQQLAKQLKRGEHQSESYCSRAHHASHNQYGDVQQPATTVLCRCHHDHVLVIPVPLSAGVLF